MIFEIIILFASIPIGIYLAKEAGDELIAGRKWFISLMALTALLGGIWAWLREYDLLLTSLFILITSTIAYKKSFDPKFAKRRI